MAQDPSNTSLAGAATGGAAPIEASASPSPPSSGRRALRVLGIVALVWSVATLILPTNVYGGFTRPGPSDCGVPLQVLFDLPGGGCAQQAMRQAVESMVLAGIGIVLIAVSDIRRRLRFIGWALVATSPFVMMVPTTEGFVEIDRPIMAVCGSGFGDLARRGDTEATFGDGGWQLLDPACGEIAANRLYMMLGVAGIGAGLVTFEAVRRSRATRPFPPDTGGRPYRA